MTNETSNDVTNAINSISESIGKIGLMQMDMITSGIKSATSAFEPLAKASIEIAQNALNALNQAVQDLSASITEKK
jgi:hypothetical protein